MNTMEQMSPTSTRRPFKLFEHPLTQFNDVVIPHRLDMMRKHKCNIEKAAQSGDYASAIKEQSAAKILVQNLRRDLAEIEALRNQVDENDLAKFDKAMEASRMRALGALEEYMRLGEQLSYPGKEPNTQSFSDDSITFAIKTAPQLQIRKNKISALDKDEEEYVRSWEKLQGDIESLHSCYADLHALTKMQGEIVDSIEDNVSSTAEHVVQGNIHLKRALRYKATMYPLFGAAIGTLIGGPVGLVIGLKAGGCAAIGGGILGFTGGKLLKKIHGTRNTPGDENVSVGSQKHSQVEDKSSTKLHKS